MKNTVFKEIMTQNEKLGLTADEEIIKELVSFFLFCSVFFKCDASFSFVGCLKFD